MPKIGQRYYPHRMFSGVFIPDAVYRHKGLTPVAKLLFGRLAKYQGDRGEAYPAAKTLSEEIGLSERQVFDHLASLVEEGFIEREPRPGTSTVYHFLWHPCFESDSDQVVRKTALPGEDLTCGIPHGGSAENRTTGSAEFLIRNESIEESQGSESLSTEPSAGPMLDPDPLDEDGVPIEQVKPRKRNWSRKAVDPIKEQRRQFREMQRERLSGMAAAGAAETARASHYPGTARTSTPPPDAGLPEAPSIDFVARWNEVNPTKPVDGALSGSAFHPRCFTDPSFRAAFEAVCGKAKILINSGADISFGHLVRYDSGSQTYGWQKLLSGEFDWMASTKKNPGKNMDWLKKYQVDKGEPK